MRALRCLVLMLAVMSTAHAAPRICSDAVGAVVGAVFVMSGPAVQMHQKVAQLVDAYPGPFREKGEITICMRLLSEVLLGASLNEAKNRVGVSSAVERWAGKMPSGLEHLPAQVDRSRGPDLTGFVALDLLFLSQELRWLATVLPEAAKGNWAPYSAQDTPWRHETTQWLKALPALCSWVGRQYCEEMIEPATKIVMARGQQIFNLATGRY